MQTNWGIIGGTCSTVQTVVETTVGAIERSTVLDKLGESLGGLVGKVLQPGVMKDVLSGTPIGHPAHPMLTDVPIGAWISANVLDLVGAHDAAGILVGVGVLAALPTAASGLSELADLGTAPERATATAHAACAVAATGLQALSWVARRLGQRQWGVMLSLAGTGAVATAGFLGGHLSFRRGIGVNHTAYEWGIDDWTPVLDDADLPDASLTQASAGCTDLVLYRKGRTICALSDRCTHAGGPLHEGSLLGDGVVCPWHASAFSLEDGTVLRGPATAPQPAYETRVRDGKIEVRSRH